MKDDYTTNSQYITYIFSFRQVGRKYFLSLGVKGLIRAPLSGTNSRTGSTYYPSFKSSVRALQIASWLASGQLRFLRVSFFISYWISKLNFARSRLNYFFRATWVNRIMDRSRFLDVPTLTWVRGSVRVGVALKEGWMDTSPETWSRSTVTF